MGFVALLFLVVLPLLCVGAGALVVYWSIRRWRRLGRATGIGAPGSLADVVHTGRAEPSSDDTPLIAPMTERACVWYEVEIEVRTGLAKYENVKTVQSEASYRLVTADGVSHVRVDPRGAFFATSGKTRVTTKMKGAPQRILPGSRDARKHRTKESIVPTGVTVTVLGKATRAEEGYRSPSVSRGEIGVVGASEGGGETIVGIGDRAALSSALAKGVGIGALLLAAGLAWGGASIWLLAVH